MKRIHVEQRENPIVNRLNKTKVEKYPDLREEREARRAELRKRDQSALQAKVCVFPKSRYPALFCMYYVRMTPFSNYVRSHDLSCHLQSLRHSISPTTGVLIQTHCFGSHTLLRLATNDL